VPAKADGAGRPDGDRRPRFRRASPEAIADAADRLVARGRREFPSQAALLEAVRRELGRSDPTRRVGARRLRRLLLDAGRARLRIAYAERADRRPLGWCPVCGESLKAVVNRTLEGDRVVLGHACRRCGYWTHLRRRVPVRYAVRLRAAPATARRSG
jgi:hypothetical protein